jgi:hypothetical protein
MYAAATRKQTIMCYPKTSSKAKCFRCSTDRSTQVTQTRSGWGAQGAETMDSQFAAPNPNRPKPKRGHETAPNFSKPTAAAAQSLANSIQVDAIPSPERRKMATRSVHAQTLGTKSIAEQEKGNLNWSHEQSIRPPRDQNP